MDGCQHRRGDGGSAFARALLDELDELLDRTHLRAEHERVRDGDGVEEAGPDGEVRRAPRRAAARETRKGGNGN